MAAASAKENVIVRQPGVVKTAKKTKTVKEVQDVVRKAVRMDEEARRRVQLAKEMYGFPPDLPTRVAAIPQPSASVGGTSRTMDAGAKVEDLPVDKDDQEGNRQGLFLDVNNSGETESTKPGLHQPVDAPYAAEPFHPAPAADSLVLPKVRRTTSPTLHPEDKEAQRLIKRLLLHACFDDTPTPLKADSLAGKDCRRYVSRKCTVNDGVWDRWAPIPASGSANSPPNALDGGGILESETFQAEPTRTHALGQGVRVYFPVKGQGKPDDIKVAVSFGHGTQTKMAREARARALALFATMPGAKRVLEGAEASKREGLDWQTSIEFELSKSVPVSKLEGGATEGAPESEVKAEAEGDDVERKSQRETPRYRATIGGKHAEKNEDEWKFYLSRVSPIDTTKMLYSDQESTVDLVSAVTNKTGVEIRFDYKINSSRRPTPGTELTDTQKAVLKMELGIVHFVVLALQGRTMLGNLAVGEAPKKGRFA